MKQLKLPERVKDILDEFVERLNKLHGNGLVSITLYGSAAADRFAEHSSNINLV